MHMRSSLFVNARASPLAAKLVVGAAGCALLSACVGNPFEDAKVDPRSPIAAEVAKSVRPHAAYPTFASIPPAPKNVRPHAQYGQAAGRVEKDAANLIAETGDSSWSITNTDAFAAKAQADAGPVLPPVSPADTEAFARDQKARATPPPPHPR